jgi:DNA polymerase
MLIGEGPGYREDQEGRPFVGPAGKFLNELLWLAGLERETVYIANVVKCRPPNNRDPEPDEISACAPYLERQLALINPRVVVTLGRFSMARFFPGEKISQIHGTARMRDGRLCVAMYHPAAGLHQASLADVIRDDFRKLPAFLQQARLLKRPSATEAEIRVTESLVARSDVIHESETARVLEQPTVYETASSNVDAQVPAQAEQAPVDLETPPPPSGVKKPKNQSETYKQMSFLDT